VFNLVKRRYLFLLISLVVIVPGTISLIFFHLDVGIDFAGGSTVELRPSIPVSPTNVFTALKPLNLQNLEVLTGDTGTTAAMKATQFIWVRLNVHVDGSVEQAIINDLQNFYKTKSLSVDPEALTYNGTVVTVITITNFPSNVVPKISDVQKVLANLPKTTEVK